MDFGQNGGAPRSKSDFISFGNSAKSDNFSAIMFSVVSESELGWLAGLFDGEGCISTFGVTKGKKKVRIDIANSDKTLIERAQAILDALEIDSSIQIVQHEPPYLPVYHLQIQGGGGVQKFFAKVPVQSNQKLGKYELLKPLLSHRPLHHTKSRRQRLARQYPSLL